MGSIFMKDYFKMILYKRSTNYAVKVIRRILEDSLHIEKSKNFLLLLLKIIFQNIAIAQNVIN